MIAKRASARECMKLGVFPEGDGLATAKIMGVTSWSGQVSSHDHVMIRRKVSGITNSDIFKASSIADQDIVPPCSDYPIACFVCNDAADPPGRRP